MLILLPPSEGKRDGTGSRFKPAALSNAKLLSKPRAQVVEGIERLCTGSASKAREILGLSARQNDELQRNSQLSVAPASPAIEIYSGVLYDALDWESLTPGAKKRGEESLLIFSALFGVVKPSDRIPAYRLSMDTKLPKIGALGSYWSKHLQDALQPIPHELIIDCRSSSYAAAWRPPVENHFTVRVMRKEKGKLVVVSHMAKEGRGQLARLLLASSKKPRTIGDVVTIAKAHFAVDIVESHKGKPGVLTLIKK